LGVRGLNRKSKKNVLYSATWRDDGQKMARCHRETKKRIDLKEQRDKQTDIQTDRQSQGQKIIDS